MWPGHRGAERHQTRWLRHFASIAPFARTRFHPHDVMLSHFPYSGGEHTSDDRYARYRVIEAGWPLVHGHVHD